MIHGVCSGEISSARPREAELETERRLEREGEGLRFTGERHVAAIDKSENSYAINRGGAVRPCEFFVFMAGEDVARGGRWKKRGLKIGRGSDGGGRARRLPTFPMHRYEYK